MAHDLVKLALAPSTLAAMSNAAKGFGSGAGVGGLVGGLGGAAIGGFNAYRDARARGASIGQAAKGGLTGMGHGAVRGAGIGALTGGVGGAIAPQLAQKMTHAPFVGAGSRFGQRQVHSLTGVGDAAYVRSIGGGAADAGRMVEQATAGLKAAKDGPARAKALEHLRSAQGALQHAEKAEAMGLTSIPGYVKSFSKDPRATLSAGAKSQWSSMTPSGRAMMVGLPAAGAGAELLRGKDDEGKGRFERAGRVLGGAASGLLAPLAITGDVVAGGALSGGFGRLGRLADRSMSNRRPAQSPLPEPGQGSSLPSESYVLSDRAAGTAGESVTG